VVIVSGGDIQRENRQACMSAGGGLSGGL
jgi:hypothetical protein